ncbi:hypothetical protein ILYODFUR_014283, partial [Ilyodon furcidens]
SQQRRQLDYPPSQVKTLNLSTPGGSCSNNLLVFPVPVPDYFIDKKNRRTFPSECFLYVGQIYTENDSAISLIISLPSTFPSLTLTLIFTVNKDCAAFPQALKESLTLHSHNHFRPSCLGRHLHWDSPAASQIRPRSRDKKRPATHPQPVKRRNQRQNDARAQRLALDPVLVCSLVPRHLQTIQLSSPDKLLAPRSFGFFD